MAILERAAEEMRLPQRVRAYVAMSSEHHAALALGVSRTTLRRVLAGLPVRRGTALLLTMALDAKGAP